MTTLDAKALEAAESVVNADKLALIQAATLRAAIRAYLDALPPARTAWARPKILSMDGAYLISKDRGHFDDELSLVEIEIREVRQP